MIVPFKLMSFFLYFLCSRPIAEVFLHRDAVTRLHQWTTAWKLEICGLSRKVAGFEVQMIKGHLIVR